MNKEFNEGDVVQLKSGGPKMTISDDKPDFNNSVIVYWYEQGEIKSQELPNSILMLVKTFSL